MPTNCNSLRDFKEYISEEKPYVDYCIKYNSKQVRLILS